MIANRDYCAGDSTTCYGNDSIIIYNAPKLRAEVMNVGNLAKRKSKRTNRKMKQRGF